MIFFLMINIIYPQNDNTQRFSNNFEYVYSVKKTDNQKDTTTSTPIFAYSRNGYEVDFLQNEYSLGIYYEQKIGIYRPTFELNVAITMYEGKSLVSSTALYCAGYTIIAGAVCWLIEGKNIADITNREKIFFICCLPIALIDGEHHIDIINPPSPENIDCFGLSAFINFRTDVFEKKGVIYAPGIGLQTEYNWGSTENFFARSIALQAGVEYPYEFKLKHFQEVRAFLGVKFSFEK